MLKHHFLIVPAVALSLLSGSGSAKDRPDFAALLSAMQGTLSVSSQPRLAVGAVTGCTLVFDALYQDWTYRSGRFLRITGSVGFIVLNNEIGATLKVVVHEIDASAEKLEMTPYAPSRVYILDRNLTTNLSSLVLTSRSDQPGALFAIFHFSPTFEMVMEALAKNELTVAFNSNGGGRDMQLKLELDVVDVTASGERKRSDQAKDEFRACNRKLIDRLK